MEQKYIFPPHNRISFDPSELAFTRSREIYLAIISHDYCNLIEVGKCEEMNVEYIIADVDVQRPQFPVNPIKNIERVLIEVPETDSIPWVYAIRDNFPKLPHQNLMTFEEPKCLCLYAQSIEEILATWTAFSFLEKIRNWFSLSAKGTLHQNDQPLEPFFINSIGNIILPKTLKAGDVFNLTLVSQNGHEHNFLINDPQNPPRNGIKHYLEVFISEPVVHGFINKEPQNLADLIQLFNIHGLDLSQKIKEYSNNSSLYGLHLVIVLFVPQKRDQNSEAETVDAYAFLCLKNIAEICLATSILSKEGTNIAPLIGSKIDLAGAANLQIGVLRPYDAYSTQLAKALSKAANELKIVQIGLGAIGSGLFNILSRSGFGHHWTLVDDDVLLPHNLYRHSLLHSQVGQYKARAVSETANAILEDNEYSSFFVEKVKTENVSAGLDERLQDADLIIDSSASLSVSRTLSRMPYGARRVSFFLNPKGDTLVCIAEDQNRELKLNELEPFYYQQLYKEPELNTHFINDHQGIRYGLSCRDVSNFIPSEHFGIFNSIASGVVKKLSNHPHEFIRLWKLNNDLSVSHFQVDGSISKFESIQSGLWTIHITENLLSQLNEKRLEKLPSETGGILIGSIDPQSKNIYIVDTIFSPSDSKEYPTAYYRGIDGLEEQLKHIENCTDNYITYLGEWHSHPKGYSVNQSSDDLILFSWLSDFMQSRGLPGIMLIVGDDSLGIYVTD
ncbi:ThiF family adenylyltransferase [Haliscomenobacter sp.]|uniref:ThiF family adenylyltransferase n=1 Tax=Haliscomenobacter sp. TaxID=2717303 RepID=UPI003BA9E761